LSGGDVVVGGFAQVKRKLSAGVSGQAKAWVVRGLQRSDDRRKDELRDHKAFVVPKAVTSTLRNIAIAC
jgi:hypothetical protein